MTFTRVAATRLAISAILAVSAGCTLDWGGQWPAPEVDTATGFPDSASVDSGASDDGTSSPSDGGPDAQADASAPDARIFGCAQHTEALFCEDFNSGAPPFSFRTQLGRLGELSGACGAGHGACWREAFEGSAGYFGFQLQRTWSYASRVYVRFFFRYGDSETPYSWLPTSGEHEVYLPEIDSGGFLQVIHRQSPDASDTGSITVRIAEGQELLVPLPVKSNTWHCLELMFEEGGSNDTIAAWLDSSNELKPAALLSGSNLSWRSGGPNVWSFGRRLNRGAQPPNRFYFDDVVIATRYIGCDG